MPSYLLPMTSLCPVLARYKLVRSGPYACLSSMYVQNLPVAHVFVVVGLHSLSTVFFLLFYSSPFLYGLPCLGTEPCLMVRFAFQLTLFPTIIFCHITLSFMLWSCLPQSCWAYLGLPFILLLMAQYCHWFFYYITSGLLCPICFPLGVPGLFVFLGLPQPFS